MQSSVQNGAIHENPCTGKDMTNLSEKDHDIAATQENLSVNDEVLRDEKLNPVYTDYLRATENPYSFDTTSTENGLTHCTADYVQ